MKLEGDPEGQDAVRGIIVGLCLGGILWTIALMIAWTAWGWVT